MHNWAARGHAGVEATEVQAELPFRKEKGRTLDVAALESWLWEAACQIRGPLDAPKFKDYILPLVFLKRLDRKVTIRITPREPGEPYQEVGFGL